jgi:hypothetical protein
MRWTVEGTDSSPGRCKIFLISMSFRPVLGPTEPPIQRVSGALSSAAKQPRRETDHPPTSSAEVENAWICTSSPHTALTALTINSMYITHMRSFFFCTI